MCPLNASDRRTYRISASICTVGRNWLASLNHSSELNLPPALRTRQRDVLSRRLVVSDGACGGLHGFVVQRVTPVASRILAVPLRGAWLFPSVVDALLLVAVVLVDAWTRSAALVDSR